MTYNIQQCADHLGVTPSLVRRLIRQGRISATAIGTGRRKIWLVERSELLKYKPNPRGRPRLTLSRPADKSLAAYKRWVSGNVKMLTGSAANSLTPAEWKRDHAKFWNSH